MTHRSLTPLGAAAAMLTLVGAVSFAGLTLNFIVIAETAGSEGAQTQRAAAKTNAAPKTTRWGDPDLQGVYNILSLTPLERPARFADKEFLTEAEVAEIEKSKPTKALRRRLSLSKATLVFTTGSGGILAARPVPGSSRPGARR